MGFHDWALQLRFYLFYCFLSVVLAVECQSWLNVTRLWGEKYTLEAHKYQPKRPCYKFFNPPSLQCACDFCLSCWMLHWRAYLWEYRQKPTWLMCGWQQEKKHLLKITGSRRTEIKTTCVTFLPALAMDSGHWTIWNYVSTVSILLCEIKYRYCGLWWMERVSQISVTSTLKDISKMAL